jgi:hypothetical protein
LVLFFLNSINDLIHEILLPTRSGGRTVSSRIGKIATAHWTTQRFNKSEISDRANPKIHESLTH